MTEKARKPFDPTDINDPRYDPAGDPTHPFYESDRSDADASDPPDENYKVGPGCPPKEHTWKKGAPSPNPKGRPKQKPSIRPDLAKILESALNETVTITDKNKKKVMSKFAVGIQQLVNGFAKGDRHCRRDLFLYAPLLGVDLQSNKEAIEAALGIDQQAIVDAYMRRHLATTTKASPEVHVKAPPDLVDDDVPKGKLIEQAVPNTPAPPPRPTKMPVEPVFDENGVALPVTDRRYIRTQSERYIAWQKKQAES
jgi:hypothetical protein